MREAERKKEGKAKTPIQDFKNIYVRRYGSWWVDTDLSRFSRHNGGDY
jgi:hypothetical protein